MPWVFKKTVVRRQWPGGYIRTIERQHGQRFATSRQAIDETLAWLFRFNQARMHSTLNRVSPMGFKPDGKGAVTKIAA
jgi:hypothetical protein